MSARRSEMACQHESTLRDIMSTLTVAMLNHGHIFVRDTHDDYDDITDEQLGLALADLSRALVNCFAMISNSLAPERATDMAKHVAESHAQLDDLEREIREAI